MHLLQMVYVSEGIRFNDGEIPVIKHLNKLYGISDPLGILIFHERHGPFYIMHSNNMFSIFYLQIYSSKKISAFLTRIKLCLVIANQKVMWAKIVMPCYTFVKFRIENWHD